MKKLFKNKLLNGISSKKENEKLRVSKIKGKITEWNVEIFHLKYGKFGKNFEI